MTLRTLISGGLLTTMVLASPVPAEVYEFDKAHTQILFFVDHLGFSRSQGEFRDYDGHFSFDPDNPTEASTEISIRTASIDMDDYEWDKHMRSEDFFDVNVHPTMAFKSTKVESLGEDRYRVHGDLTLLGETRPVALEFKFNKAGVHPISKRRVAGFSGTGVIKRSDFGMDHLVPMIGDEVELRLEVEGVRVEG
jgi:polyisoprenoid-binding protein YceI